MSTNHENIRLDSMAKELESIKGEVSEMKTMIKDIHTLLAGNPIDKSSGGLLSDFKHMRDEIDLIKEELKKYKSFFYALLTLIGIGALKVIIDFLIK